MNIIEETIKATETEISAEDFKVLLRNVEYHNPKRYSQPYHTTKPNDFFRALQLAKTAGRHDLYTLLANYFFECAVYHYDIQAIKELVARGILRPSLDHVIVAVAFNFANYHIYDFLLSIYTQNIEYCKLQLLEKGYDCNKPYFLLDLVKSKQNVGYMKVALAVYDAMHDALDDTIHDALDDDIDEMNDIVMAFRASIDNINNLAYTDTDLDIFISLLQYLVHHGYGEQLIAWIRKWIAENKQMHNMISNKLGSILSRAAYKKENIETIQYLLTKLHPIIPPTFNYDYAVEKAFLHACQEGHVEIAILLLGTGVTLHVIYEYALRKASKNGQLDMIQFLIEQGANVNSSKRFYDNDKTALACASEAGQSKAVRLLLDYGASIDQPDGIGKRSLLYHAIIIGTQDIKTIGILLMYGEDPETWRKELIEDEWTSLIDNNGISTKTLVLLDYGYILAQQFDIFRDLFRNRNEILQTMEENRENWGSWQYAREDLEHLAQQYSIYPFLLPIMQTFWDDCYLVKGCYVDGKRKELVYFDTTEDEDDDGKETIETMETMENVENMDVDQPTIYTILTLQLFPRI